MSNPESEHKNHDHKHSENCGHTAIIHDGHTDYLHDGHLHHISNNGTVQEHHLDIDKAHPDSCTPEHDCHEHNNNHSHGPDCGHQAIPHGDHTDYIVNDHLHHPHSEHCDNHGEMKVIK